MRILVTGSTGFIGGALARRLEKLGHEIFCLARKTSDISSLESLRVSVVRADIRNAEEVDAVFDALEPDIVFHSAASVRERSEEKLREANVAGTGNVCASCFKHGVKRLVYLSSVAVVSGNSDLPLTDSLPYKASEAYGRTKIEAEKVVIGYRVRGLAVSIIRPCMVYGEGEPHAMDRILDMIGKRLLPVVDIPGIRDKLQLVYVENVVDALVLAMEKNEALSGTFMIADKEVITLRKFIEIVSEELGKGRPPALPAWLVRPVLVIPYFKKRFDRIFKDRVYDISRSVDLLGYDPKISTEDGLRRTVRWWRNKSRK